MFKMDHKYHRAALIPQLINAYGEWVENYIDQFRVYLVTFKFNNIPGSALQIDMIPLQIEDLTQAGPRKYQ